MARGMRGFLAAALVVLLMLVLPPPGGMRPGERLSAGPPDALTRVQVLEAYGLLPLRFEANRGQSDPRVKFLARGRGYNLFLTAQEAVLVLADSPRPPGRAGERLRPWNPSGSRPAQVVRLRFVGATTQPQVTGHEALPGNTSYFIGNDPARWRTDIPTYARVRYQGIYRGVDLEYYGSQEALEYDLRVAPGADPARIRLRVEGAERVEVDAQGDLVLHLAGGEIRQRKPVMYQQGAGRRQLIAGGYVLMGPHEVGVRIGPYDARRPLIIDPVVLAYSTYLGGSGPNASDEGRGIAVDLAGNAYVTGVTESPNFPTTPGAFQSTSPTPGGFFDHVFVTKLNPMGTALVYSTYLGGSGPDVGRGIAVDLAGNAYVTGFTGSTNFPTTPGAFQSTSPTPAGGFDHAFVTKLNPTGTGLVYSTYLGGSRNEAGRGIAVDLADSAYVTGETTSPNFPTTPGAFQTTFPGGPAFVTKLHPAGSSLVYSTYLGGTGFDTGFGIAVDLAGSAYVTGVTESPNFPTTPGAFQTTHSGLLNAFVTKLDPMGAALVYSTYLGGSGFDFGIGIAVDLAGNAYVTGLTQSANFPVTPGAFQTAFGAKLVLGSSDVFVAKVNTAASGTSSLVYSTYLGGNGSEFGRGIAVDAAGNAYVTGDTSSPNFPTTPGAFQTTFGGDSDAFVTKLNPIGTALVYSTYLGGSFSDTGLGITVDLAGSAYVTGDTLSTNFPTTPGVFQSTQPGFRNAFVAKIATCIPFASFSAKVDISVRTGAFDLNSIFMLGTGSSRINPLTQPVTLTVGGFTITIPAGSFQQNGEGDFVFEGIISGVALEVIIAPQGGNSFTFKAEAAGVSDLPTTNPVTMGLTIGNNCGSTTVTAEIE